MFKPIALATLSVAGIFLAGCGFIPAQVVGSGKVVTEDRQVSNFNQVAVSGIGDLVITQGQDETLKIEAEDNLIPLIKTEISNGKLTISFEDRGRPVSIHNTKPIKYFLGVKDLQGITVSGSGNVSADALSTGDLKLTLSGSGNFNLASLQAKKLAVVMSGSGDFDLAGKADSQDVNISGSGTYRAGDLETSNTVLSISGSGKTQVWATENLDLRVSGSGDVEYYGQPKMTQNISGSGKIRSLGTR